MSIFDFNYTIDSSWLSASKTRNYLLNDPLIDYLEYTNNTQLPIITNNKKRKREDSFLSTILDNGLKFEKQIIHKLNEKFPNQITTVINTDDDSNIINRVRDPANFKSTIDLINKKVPIIYQGVLHNRFDKTYGVPDIIIRGDYINKIFDNKLNIINNDAYYIIDIKNSQLHLSANSDNILNTSNLKPYKGQILIYHQIISKIQGFDTGYAFILANRWIRKKLNLTTESYNPFDRLGIINYKDNDESYVKSVSGAVSWRRLIRNPSNGLNHLKPNHPNLYPNMNNQAEPRFKKIKLDLAESNYEITSLWMCGVKHRANAIRHNIDNWMDPRLNSKILGISGANGKILDHMLNINRSSDQIIHPNRIDYRLNNWRDRNSLAFYIDFETLNKTSFELEKTSNPSNDIIFMIGIGYNINNKFKYKCLFTQDLSADEQIRVINQMIDMIKEISATNSIDYQNVNLYHWSNFEPMILSKTCSKFNIVYPIFKWVDILDMFHSEPIIIKGALNFSLKTIGKSMYKLGLISTIWKSNSNVSDGLDAMYEAYKIYQTKDKPIGTQMKQIIKYNKVDCKIMWDILNALNRIA